MTEFMRHTCILEDFGIGVTRLAAGDFAGGAVRNIGGDGQELARGPKASFAKSMPGAEGGIDPSWRLGQKVRREYWSTFERLYESLP